MTEEKFYRTINELSAEHFFEQQISSFEISDDIARQTISSAREEGHLALVLGAGVSRPSGLGDWRELIRNAAEKALGGSRNEGFSGALLTSGLSLTVQVRILEEALGHRAAFRGYLVDALYENYDSSSTNHTLDTIADTILGLDGRAPVQKVVTYNFDDLLEVALMNKINKHNIDLEISSIYSMDQIEQTKKSEVVKIFHPHGFLPFSKKYSNYIDNPIVLSEYDYHRHFFKDQYWANTLQIDTFTRNTCLFVGLSFLDENLRRLLDFVNFQSRNPQENKHSAIIRHNTEAKNEEFTKLKNFFVQKNLNSLGLNPIWFTEFSEIPSVIKSLWED